MRFRSVCVRAMIAASSAVMPPMTATTQLRVGRGGKQRRAAGDHVDAGRDHRGRVDQGADGRGAFHRVGQPDVQRELGALAAGAEHQQQADRRGRRRRRRTAPDRPAASGRERPASSSPSADRVVEIERAVGRPDQEHAQGEAEVADAVDQERLLAGRGRRGLLDTRSRSAGSCTARPLPRTRTAARSCSPRRASSSRRRTGRCR